MNNEDFIISVEYSRLKQWVIFCEEALEKNDLDKVRYGHQKIVNVLDDCLSSEERIRRYGY